MSIALSLIHLAADEGKPHAVKTAQEWQSVLEQIQEVGNDEERELATHMLFNVNWAIGQILHTPAVQFVEEMKA